MALEDQLTQDSQGRLTPEEEQDLDILVNLSKNLLDDAGADIIDGAQNSRDPAQVIGQFLMQLMAQLNEQLAQMDITVSPRVLLAHGGWVEQISDYLQEQFDVPKAIMDRAEIFIATQAEAMANAQQGGAPQGQPAPEQAPAQPVMPQGGM